jgi:hypothetical protein
VDLPVPELAGDLVRALGRCRQLQVLSLGDWYGYWSPGTFQLMLDSICWEHLLSLKMDESSRPDYDPMDEETGMPARTIEILSQILRRCVKLQTFEYDQNDGRGADLFPLLQALPWASIQTVELGRRLPERELNYLSKEVPWRKEQQLSLFFCFESLPDPLVSQFITTMLEKCDFYTETLYISATVAKELLGKIAWKEIKSSPYGEGSRTTECLPIELVFASEDINIEDDESRRHEMLVKLPAYANLSSVETLDFSSDTLYSLSFLKYVIIPLIAKCPKLTTINLSYTEINPVGIAQLRKTIGSRPIRLILDHCPNLLPPPKPANSSTKRKPDAAPDGASPAKKERESDD